MTDKEKIHLISKMIHDFWECSTSEEISRDAETMIVAINAVIGLKGGGKE